MYETFTRGELDALADHAHWLKGAGGTVGFAQFTEPARQLELLAKDHSMNEIPLLLKELVELAEAVRIGVNTSEDEPSSLCNSQ